MSILQKIVEDMYVEPELLAQLTEEQKQVLFCKMREQQIRKYKDWDRRMTEQEQRATVRKAQKPGSRRVQFRLGADGEPWTWVMGDEEGGNTPFQHARSTFALQARNDPQAMIRAAATKRLRDEEEKLKERLRQEMLESNADNDSTSKPRDTQTTQNNTAVVSVQDWESPASQMLEKIRSMPGLSNDSKPQSEPSPPPPDNPAQLRMQQDIADQRRREDAHFNEQNAIVTELPRRQTGTIVATAPTATTPSSSYPDSDEQAQEKIWREQERKAKEHEREIREIARRARAQHRSNSLKEASSSVSELADQLSMQNLFHSLRPTRPLKPPSKQAVVEWFRKEERPFGTGVDPATKKPARWFHGLIPRVKAESMLAGCAEGTFLVRVSERIWGFAVSVKSFEKVKHYLVERVPSGYQLLGTNMVVHNTLLELVTYHKNIPLKEEDYLREPLGQSQSPPDYEELFSSSIYSTEL